MNVSAVAKSFALACVATALISPDAAFAQRGRRIDTGGGDQWEAFDASAGQTVDLGFTLDFFGVSTGQATLNADGSISFGSDATTALIAPFQEADQIGNSAITYSRTLATTALPTGVEAGFRVDWLVGPEDSPSNLFQLALFDLGAEGFGMEFNYESLLLGDDESFIGYSTSLGTSFDLLDSLGLTSFAEYSGVGFDFATFSDVCPIAGTPSALVCNNFNSELTPLAFAPGIDILPSGYLLGDETFSYEYFRVNPSFLTDITGGRYSFFFPDSTPEPPVAVPEPGSLFLTMAGLLALLIPAWRRRERRERS